MHDMSKSKHHWLKATFIAEWAFDENTNPRARRCYIFYPWKELGERCSTTTAGAICSEKGLFGKFEHKESSLEESFEKMRLKAIQDENHSLALKWTYWTLRRSPSTLKSEGLKKALGCPQKATTEYVYGILRKRKLEKYTNYTLLHTKEKLSLCYEAQIPGMHGWLAMPLDPHHVCILGNYTEFSVEKYEITVVALATHYKRWLLVKELPESVTKLPRKDWP